MVNFDLRGYDEREIIGEIQLKDVTSIELGDLNSENVTFKNSHKFSAMVSRFWSGTILTDTCDFTREGITVGSIRIQYPCP